MVQTEAEVCGIELLYLRSTEELWHINGMRFNKGGEITHLDEKYPLRGTTADFPSSCILFAPDGNDACCLPALFFQDFWSSG